MRGRGTSDRDQQHRMAGVAIKGAFVSFLKTRAVSKSLCEMICGDIHRYVGTANICDDLVLKVTFILVVACLLPFDCPIARDLSSQCAVLSARVRFAVADSTEIFRQKERW